MTEKSGADRAGRAGDGSSASRLLAILRLLSVDDPARTVDEFAVALGVSVSTAYRYVQDLSQVGLLDPVGGGRYVLGPAIIELDRQIRQGDPLLRAAVPVARWLRTQVPAGTTVVLCRLYREQVMCVHQEIGRSPMTPAPGYERGLPMSLYRGATSKIILANLPARRLRSLFARDAEEIARAGLGGDWESFKAELKDLRQAGFCRTESEVTPGRVGIAAPVLGESGVVGSISLVLSETVIDEAGDRLTALARSAAAEIGAALVGLTASDRQTA